MTQKSTLKPLRLVPLATRQSMQEWEAEDTLARTEETDVPLEHSPSQGEAAAQDLLKRTPSSYLLNQLYGLWFFVSMFFLTVIVTRKLSANDYGVFAIAWTAFNTIAYIVALGLEDATTTFVPRVLAEHGMAAAALLMRRLLGLR